MIASSKCSVARCGLTTVIAIVLSLKPSLTALMEVVTRPTDETKPEALTVATASLDDVHETPVTATSKLALN